MADMIQISIDKITAAMPVNAIQTDKTKIVFLDSIPEWSDGYPVNNYSGLNNRYTEEINVYELNNAIVQIKTIDYGNTKRMFANLICKSNPEIWKAHVISPVVKRGIPISNDGSKLFLKSDLVDDFAADAYSVFNDRLDEWLVKYGYPKNDFFQDYENGYRNHLFDMGTVCYSFLKN